MKLAIMQPYFLPYIGYFQLMAAADQFVIYDDVNFMKGGWLNRNRIRSFGNVQWLTIPLTGASPNKLIREVDTQINPKFVKKTLRVIEGAYQKASNFNEGFAICKRLLDSGDPNLARFTLNSLVLLAEYLDISCKIVPTSSCFENHHLSGEERVLDICRQTNATTYVNVPGGRSLYDSNKFFEQGIALKFIEPQLTTYADDFEPGLSILDVIMNTSREESRAMAHQVVLSDGT